MDQKTLTKKLDEDIYLRDLPLDTGKHVYTGLDEFWYFIDMENAQFNDPGSGRSSEYVVFLNVSNETFTQDFDIAIHKSSWQLFNSHNPSTEILVVKMATTREHEIPHSRLANLLIMKLTWMNGANLSLVMYGAAQVETPSRRKKPDVQFAPRKLPQGRSRQWPTLVMETGYSESKPQLDRDAMWWIKESKGDVKVAVTIAVNRRKPEIVFRRWGPARTGQLEPVLQQSVVVSKTRGQSEVNVSNGPLVIPFSELFLRQPVEANSEGDIIFTDEELEDLAQEEWEGRNF